MKNTRLCFGICLCLLVTTTIVFAGSKNTLIRATYQTAPILDSLSCNDSSSGIKTRNIYHILKQFDVASTENFLLLLATRVSTLANGDSFLLTFSHSKGARSISSQGSNSGVKRLSEESSVCETSITGKGLSQLVMESGYRKYIISLAPYAVFDDACEILSA
jgi:hypothetical protein